MRVGYIYMYIYIIQVGRQQKGRIQDLFGEGLFFDASLLAC